jgi:hypothetical protein
MYEVTPLRLNPTKSAEILNNLIRFETMFSDYQPACESVCGYCEKCIRRKMTVVSKLTALDAMAFEVWKDDRLVGILYITDIVAGHDAMAHFNFWDKDLRGKAGIINSAIDSFVFSGDLNLHRLTIQVPTWMKSLCRFVERKLDFQLEGTKKEVVLWQGEWRDVNIYGRVSK